MEDKRFIEETFPVKKVSIESAREKNIRHGHISTLHIWWARRPLASSRATAYAALIPPPKNVEEWNKKREFIAEFSKWENSLNQTMIQKAREEILKANGGKPPRVLDPFSGGGAIPLEALRLGCETYASDLNPVAVLIEKCTLEYPQKYGKKKPAQRSNNNAFSDVKDDKVQGALFSSSETEKEANPLVEDVKKWGQWVLEQAKNEIGKFYPEDKDGSIPVGYIWARTIPCQNPSCRAEIPLMRQYWLAKKAKKKVALFPYVEDGRVHFKVVGTDYDDMRAGFDPTNGTVSRAVATCPVCGATIDANTTRKLFQEGKSGQRMVAVVLYKPGQTGKRYRIATAEDMKVFQEAEAHLEKKREQLMAEWGIDPVPDEPLPPKETLGFRVQRYGMLKWGDLFNSRQKLALITFAEKVRQAYKLMPARWSGGQAQGYDPEYAKAVVSYLGLILSRCSDFSSTLAAWLNHVENAGHVFARQALAMTWDYLELNLFSHVSQGTIKSMLTQSLRTIEGIINTSSPPGLVDQCSAASLPYSDGYFDAILTDPPYYDNVPYSYLSDFFYVWLKRILADVYPDLFSTPLTPKKSEIVAYSHGEGGFEVGKQFFEDMLKKSFQEIHRVLKPNGIAVIVYAHKSTQGWETLVNSLLDSGLIMTGAWPINTEMQARLRAQESATLASSIYIVARKMKREQTGFYQEVRQAIEEHLNKKLERLWQEGIGGADFFISAIGSAIEVFGKYEKVMDYEGNIIRADRLLEDVRKIATEFAVRQILHNGFTGEISDLTRFYVLYRWNYGHAKVHFDEARKLAASCGIDIAREWNHGFIRKQKEFIRVLGPSERNASEL
ncbi:MAG: DUF1156 domain-containing protein, partial [Deltaproteobacteria bacterium]|nr:DUF1156 domain-containing protein [Deltaproteobacteria bacterium]